MQLRFLVSTCTTLVFFILVLSSSFASSSIVRYHINVGVCPPIQLKNGIAKKRIRTRVVRYFCLRGYYLYGDKHSTCLNGNWFPAPPKCVRPGCKLFQQTSENLMIYSTHHGAVHHFFCKAGYRQLGPSEVFCNGSRWSNNAPTCMLDNEKPKLACDFENVDLCGWTYDLNNDFDWKRENNRTATGVINTGPSFDHTKGPGKDGYYMYIESQSKEENDTTRLISPVFNKMDGDTCFEFFYHMFGATIDTLRVYLKKASTSWDLQPQSAFFTKTGNQGDKWYRSYHNLGRINEDFQLVIEGVRGKGYVSDIAIDDVRIIPNCKYEDETTTTMFTYNDLIPTVDSCNYRCGKKEPKSSDNYHLTCDCDDDCFYNNRCCPDYYDLCAFETSTVAFETTNAKNVTVRLTTAKYLAYSKKAIVSHKPTQQVRFVNASAPTRTTMPVIYFKTPPVTSVIHRKTISVTSRAPTTVGKTVSTAKFKNDIKKLATAPVTNTNSVTKKMATTPTSDDAIEVPRPTNNDEGLYDANSGSKEYWSDEIENSLNTPLTRNINESKTLFSQTRVEEKGSHFAVMSLGICAVVILIAVVSVVAVRRYRISRRSMSSSNGESQSDVRFLTNSDVLDLSLANNYDELLS